MTELPIKNIVIRSLEGITEMIAAEQIDEQTYLILENPLFSCQVNYGTIVKVILNNHSGQLEMTKISRPSKFSTRKFLMSEKLSQKELNNKFNKIIEVGGTWEVAMGGLIFFHLPRNSAFDLNNFFAEINFNPTEINDDDKSN